MRHSQKVHSYGYIARCPTAWADAEDHCFFRSGSDASQLEEATWLSYSAYLGGRLSPHTSGL